MSTQSVTRPAVDLAAPRARAAVSPGLALALALLSLPGVTVAWELPAGGFWIGIPLAIAAVVVGTRARRAEPSSRRAKAAVLVGAFAIALVALCTAGALL